MTIEIGVVNGIEIDPCEYCGALIMRAYAGIHYAQCTTRNTVPDHRHRMYYTEGYQTGEVIREHSHGY